MAEVSEIEASGEVRTIKDPVARKSLIYSTDEVDTSQKWIDNKKIYKKTFEFTPSAQSASVSDLSIDTPIKLEGLVLNNNSDWRTFDGYLTTLGSNQLNGSVVTFNKNNNTLSIANMGGGMGYAFTKAHVTIYYTKTTD